MTQYQKVCDDCSQVFMGRSPSQATFNWSQHFKTHHTATEELEAKMVEAAKVGWSMGFRAGISQYGKIREDGKLISLDVLKKEVEELKLKERDQNG